MVVGIYSIYNKSNGKYYIGQSINVRKRWNEHKSNLNRNIHPNKHLQSAWNLYGSDSFEFKLVKSCKPRYLDRFEKLLIKSHDSMNPVNGYNLDSGGSEGYVLSDNTRMKMSKAQSGKNHPLYGKNHSKETKQKMSKSKKGEDNPFFGKHHSQDTRKRISMTKSRKDIPSGEHLYHENNQGIIFEELAKKYNCSIGTIHYRIKNYKKENGLL